MSSFYTYQKSQSYDACFLKFGVQQREFFVILGQFLPFYPTNNLKNQNFEKMKRKKKAWRYYPFTHVHNNEDHMMHGS